MADVDTSTGAQKVGSPQPEQSSAPTASTPPPSSTQQQSQQQTSTQSSSQQQQQQQQSQQAGGATQTSDNGPSSSLNDPGTSTRPHDARTIHMILASLGVTAYQERVPLQLLDFAYRYTSSVLSDAQHLAAEGYVSSASGGGGGKGAAGTAGDQIPLAALRLATSSRLGYQFSSSLPKQTMLDLAKERNKIALPDPGEKLVFGLNLPHERFVQTGTNWTMLEEWDSEEAAREDDAAGPAVGDGENDTAVTNGGDAGDTGDDKDEDMEDGYDAVFGGDEEDKTMEES